ncbi:phage head completion protein, partial [Enterococcus faecium]
MPLIQTGNLNQRIKFVRDTTVKDEDGQVVPTSTTILTCWASVQTQR